MKQGTVSRKQGSGTPIPAPTADELMAAVRAAIAPPPDDPGVSVSEFAASEKVGRGVASNALERGVRSGKLVRGWALRPVGDGRITKQCVYRPA